MENKEEVKYFHNIEQLKAGSKDAFRGLFNEYGPKIFAFALSYLKNKADAEELLQEVFLKLWEKRTNLDASKNIKSFLFKICINQIYDLIRKKNVEQAFVNFSWQNNPSGVDNTWQDVVYHEMQDNLQRYIADMPNQMQRVFRLSKEDGLSNEEIAKALNLSKRTVENQLYRAISILKTKFGTGSLPAILFFFLFCNW